MATVNFSVPSDIKDAFDKAFAGQNKSAVLTNLMRQAVDEQQRKERRARAIAKLLGLRNRMTPADATAIRRARTHGRP
jgi:hypothetical protein